MKAANAAALVFFLTSALFAQIEQANLTGVVTDDSGAVVPGATVLLTNRATKVNAETETNPAGLYRLPFLSAGVYDLKVTKAGFDVSRVTSIRLTVGLTATVNLKLRTGTVQQEVTVTASAVQLEQQSATLGNVVGAKQMIELPLLGRNPYSLVLLAPGVLPRGSAGSGPIINGGRSNTSEVLLDGAETRNSTTNDIAYTPPLETVQEFKVLTNSFSSEFGRSGGGVLTVATRSGTNQLHGSAYYYGQNDALRANGFSSNAIRQKRQPFKQHNYGYSAGGPVMIPKLYDGRNKTFWFHNMEKTSLKNYSSTSFTQLPTTDFKRGDFSRILSSAFTGAAGSGGNAGTDAAGRPVQFGAIYDPNTARQVDGTWVRDIFPGNVIPRNRFSPVSSKILELAPIDDPLFDQMLLNTPALASGSPEFNERMLTFKGDHNFTTSHRLSGMVNRNFRKRFNSPGGRWGTPPGTPTGVFQNQNNPGTMVRLAYDFMITPTLLGRANLGYNRFGNINESYFVDQDWPAKIGLQNVPGTHFPVLTFSGLPAQGGGIGAGGRLSSGNRGGSFNGSTIGQVDMTKVSGKHNYKFGFENRRYYYNTRAKSGSGDFAFSPNQTAQPGFLNQTGHSFASFLLGTYNTTNRNIVSSNFGHRWRSAGFYFQDDWKVTPRLTLNVGLRWEVIGGLIEVAGRMSAIDFTVPNPGAANKPGALVFANDRDRRGFQDTYWKQISPKFGFAYALSNKLVMRGGYGINNTPPISNGFGFGGTLGYNGAIQVNLNTRQVPFPEAPLGNISDRYPDFAGTLPNKLSTLANQQGIDYYPRSGNRMPYVQNWNFGFQYQLPAKTVVEVNYVGNKGTRLIAYGFSQPNNVPFTATQQYGDILPRAWSASSPIPAPYAGFSGTNLQALRPYAQFTGINDIFPNIGNSSYNSAQIQVTRHFTKGLAILGAYTWSKAIGLTDKAIDSEGVADVFNRNLERSITNYHYPHVAKLSWVYELPIGANRLVKLNGIADKIMGGWQMTGIHGWRSGNPLSISTGGINLPTGNAVRPDLVAGVPIVLNADAPMVFRGAVGGTAYLNRLAFTNPPVFAGGQNVVQRLGTVGPYLPNLRDRRLTTFDASIQKMFKFDEQRNIELCGTFLNAFNWAGVGGLNTNITSPFFGQYTGPQLGPRNIEIALRFTF